MDIYAIARLDSLAVISVYSIGVAWLCVGLLQDSPDTNVFYWVTQNVMGACICISFLSVIKLNSIKVATVLLLAAFVYDIFFVFITPYLFDGESIMISVATSGGVPDDPNFCEKYPDASHFWGQGALESDPASTPAADSASSGGSVSFCIYKRFSIHNPF